MDYLARIQNIADMVCLAGDFSLPEGAAVPGDGFAVCENDRVRVTTAITSGGHGVMERSDTVENVSGEPLRIRTALSRFRLAGGDYEIYTQYSQWTGESRGAWAPLHTSVGARNSDVRSNTSAAPFFALFNRQTGRGLAFHILEDGMWQYEVRRHYVVGGEKDVRVELGFDNRNTDITLAPGEKLRLPKILFYPFRNRLDMDAYRLHRYCRERYCPKAFPVVYNTWMSNFDRVSLEGLTQQLEKAEKLGAEYFVMDAGWFGAPNGWFDAVGDWAESAESGLRGQLSELADRVRRRGLKFGLWFEIERASLKSRTYREHPEFYISQNGNAFVNFGDPEACDYIFDILAANIRRYGIEYIKFDFNANFTDDPRQKAFSGYMAGYRSFVARLAGEFPQVYLENCASGGLRMSLSSLEGFDSFWISDNHSLYTQLEIFKNTLIRMPSRALETWISIRSLEDFGPVYNGDTTEKIIMSGDACWNKLEVIPEDYLQASVLGGPIGISCDLTKVSEKTRAGLRDLIAEVKEDRAFWLGSECHILCDSPGLLVLQFCDEKYDRLVLCVYAREPDQNEVTVFPLVTPETDYLDGNGTCWSAEKLEENGIDVPLEGICARVLKLQKQ